MAKLLPGIGWSSASGSVAGVTYTRGRSGQVMRARIMTPDRQTTHQIRRRSYLQLAAQSWRELTEEDRRSGSAAAEAWPHDDLEGQAWPSSGPTLYTKLQLERLEAGLGLSTRPPNIQRLLRQTIDFGTVDVGAGQLNVRRLPATATMAVRITYATLPFSAGISNWKGLAFRPIRSSTATAMQNLYADYTTAYFPLTAEHVGMQLAWRTMAWSSSGYYSTPGYALLTIT
jgi:hypothetical protein